MKKSATNAHVTINVHVSRLKAFMACELHQCLVMPFTLGSSLFCTNFRRMIDLTRQKRTWTNARLHWYRGFATVRAFIKPIADKSYVVASHSYTCCGISTLC